MDTFLTILNYIGMGFALLCGIFGASSFKDYDTWFLLYVGTTVLTCLLYLFCSIPFPYAFAIAGFIVDLLNKSKPREGTYSAEYEKEHEQELKEYTEKYRKEHPYRKPVIQSQESNNSPSLASYFEHQQKATNEFMQKRLQTMADIRAGKAPNGTDGVWQ